jgi:Tfp pilus assembly protein PilX
METTDSTISNSQAGGVTILVALMLLVLLTVSAVAMSRNSLREVIISGTVRQGAEVRNVADTGLEWSCYWLTPDVAGLTKATPDTAAVAFLAPVKTLSGTLELSGESMSVNATGIMSNTESDGATRSFSLDVMRMGKQQLDLTGGAPSTSASGMTQAIPTELLPDIWSIRSTGLLSYGFAGTSFQHIRESWVTAPPQGQ